MLQVIAGNLAAGVLIAIEYDASGLQWARLYDNRVNGWRVDDAGLIEPAPVIIGALPTPAPDTAPVSSPQWGALAAWRGSFADFLDWLATNNGASRRLESRLGISAAAANTFLDWSRRNPDRVLSRDRRFEYEISRPIVRGASGHRNQRRHQGRRSVSIAINCRLSSASRSRRARKSRIVASRSASNSRNPSTSPGDGTG